MAKIKIIQMAKGGVNTPDPYPKKGNLANWYRRLKSKGYSGKLDVGQMQKWMVQNHPDDVLEYMNQNGSAMNTNKGKKLYGDDWNKYTDEQKLEAFNDDKWWFRDPVPDDDGKGVGLGKVKIEPDSETPDSGLTPSKTQGDYKYTASTKNKDPYKKRNLPFYQAAPELAGYVNALNTYGYYTPDFNHQEIDPMKLNIQPQLQSIDSSLTAVNDTTTGNPALDNARRSQTFTQALNAKQQAFANKQNYDANSRFEADKFNIDARNKEMMYDIEATDKVHNQYRSLAKDEAAAERIRAMSALSKKQAKHDANEAKKKLWLDNFYQNVQFDEDGNLNTVGDPMDFENDPYGSYDKPAETNPANSSQVENAASIVGSNLANIARKTLAPKLNNSPLNPNYVEPEPIEPGIMQQPFYPYKKKEFKSSFKFKNGGKYRLPL